MCSSVSFFLVLLFCVLTCRLEAVLITGTFDEKKAEELQMMTPSEYDVLLMDFPLATMKMIAKEVFGFIYNSKSVELEKFPIEGVILKKPFERVIIPITLMHKKRKIQTTCVVDTSSPWTFVSEYTLADMGIDSVSGGFDLIVHGALVTVHRSVNHFHDLNICGQSFFSEHKAELVINYHTRKATVKETTKLTQEELEEL